MSDDDKADFLDKIAHSMQHPDKLDTPEEVFASLMEIAALPLESPRDGFSGQDHDSILYGAQRRSETTR